MKQFIAVNWYRLITASALLIFACSFFVLVLKNNVAKAGIPNTQPDSAPTNTWVVVKGNTVYEVTWNKFSGYKCKPVCNTLQ